MSEPKIFRISAVVCITLVFVLLLAACGHGNQGEQETITLPQETERYYVILSKPLENQTYTAADPSPVFVWKLCLGLPNAFVIEIDTYGSHLLHHWKTYVRHFCIIKRTERYPLCNLLHVSEEDYEYLDKLLYKCSLLERSND